MIIYKNAQKNPDSLSSSFSFYPTFCVFCLISYDFPYDFRQNPVSGAPWPYQKHLTGRKNYRESSKKYEMLDKMKMKKTANLKNFLSIIWYINLLQPTGQTVWETLSLTKIFQAPSVSWIHLPRSPCKIRHLLYHYKIKTKL